MGIQGFIMLLSTFVDVENFPYSKVKKSNQ